MEYLEPFVVAKIGCNHKGDINIAKQKIRTAAFYCEANAVRDCRKLTAQSIFSEKPENQGFAFAL